MTTSAAAKVAALEGLDFIETEEDVKAVEAATLKIQSTFRGKRFGKKAATTGKPETAAATTNQKSAPTATGTTTTTSALKQVNKSAGQQEQKQATSSATATSASKSAATSKHKQPATKTTTAPAAGAETEALAKRIGEMEVQDNSAAEAQRGLPEEEAERAATKIQAGFKGYKTRKELEGQVSGGAGGANPAKPASSGGGSSSGAQQAAPGAK